jgi:hypothetical protein
MKKWFCIISPCLIAAVFSLTLIIIGYINMNDSGGWSFLAVIIFGPILFAVIVIDTVVKLIFKNKPYHIWILEIVALLVIYFVHLKNYVS